MSSLRLCSARLAILVSCAALVFGCDQQSDVDPDSTSIAFQLGVGRTVQITLDEEYQAEYRVFPTMAEYQLYLDSAGTRNNFHVNKTLWEQLGHALDPWVIEVLDSDAKMRVGDIEYRATREGAFWTDLVAAPRTENVEVFWDVDGRGVERELMTFYSLLEQPASLQREVFRNPFIREMQVAVAAGKTAAAFDFAYGGTTTICFPDNEATDLSCYSVRFMTWNESTGSSWWAQAHAGTQAQALVGGTWYGFGHSMAPNDLEFRVKVEVVVYGGNEYGSDQCISSLSVGPLDPEMDPFEPPYSYFYGSPCTEASATVSRSTGVGASSWHNAGYNDYFHTTNTGGEPWLQYYSPYYATAWTLNSYLN